MARLRPGQTAETATAALRGVQPQIREATVPDRWRPQDRADYLKEGLTLVPAATGLSSLRRRYQQPLVAIMVVVGLVLAIACANIANLLLARATARRHEFGVRAALGASRLRLARQLLVESLVLAGAGAAAGLALAAWGSRVLVHQLSTPTNAVTLGLPLDWRLLAFTTAVAVGTAVLFGLAPAFRASRVAPNAVLSEQSRSVAGERRPGLGHAMVVAQVALSLVLVVAAGLFVRTFVSLANLDLGFDRDRVLLVGINAQQSGTPMAERTALFERARQAAAAVPGVTHAALSVITPVGGSTWNNRVEVHGGPQLSERERLSNFNAVSPDWFATFGTPLAAGRDFDDRDRTGSAPVAIVNGAFARKFLPGQNPLGRTVRQEGRPGEVPPFMEIVGVARDAVYRSLREPVPPTLYVPLPQMDIREGFGASNVSLSVRAASDSPALLARSVVDAIVGVDRDLSLTVQVLSAQVNASLTQERLVATLSGSFGALALLLAGIGLYGVATYTVTRRRAELGIRMALGAAPAGVVRLVLARLAVVVAIGIVLGGIASWWAARFVGGLVYGLPARDPVTLAGAAAVLIAVSTLAGWLPARRAARIDPADVLRQG
jgi:predicted permease